MFFKRLLRRQRPFADLPSRLDREVRDEIRFYLEMRARELQGEGMEEAEAWAKALDVFGDPDDVAEDAMRERSGSAVNGRRLELMSSIMHDLDFAFRTLRKRPAFFAVALLSLALGIGANTAAFSVVNAVLVQPLNVTDHERLVVVYTSTVGGVEYGNTSYPGFLDIKEQNEIFSGLAAYTIAPMAVRGSEEPRVTWGQLVSWDYFHVLGVHPLLGRGFSREEDEAFGAAPVAVLSFSTWQNLFGGDPGVLGETVRINDSPFTVVGVAPAGFFGLVPILEPALWAPLSMVSEALPYSPNVQSRYDPWLTLVGRLRDGVSFQDAQTSLGVLAANFRVEFPAANRNKFLVISDLDAGRFMSPNAYEGVRDMIVILLGVVGFVLLVACLNVTNLQLAKATARRQEIALRYALGATRWRIVRFLLVESLVLSLLASILGLLLAVFGVDAMQTLQPRMDVPLDVPVGIDLRVLAFTAVVALVAAVLSGLAPALQSLRSGQSDALKDQSYASGRSRSSVRLQDSFVVGQVAISLVLLAGAGLLVKSFQQTAAVDPGFDLRQGLVVPLNLGYGRYDNVGGKELQRRLLDRVLSMPEVESAALAASLPLGLSHGHHDVYVEGYSVAENETVLVKRNKVSAGYFETMGIRVVNGRAINESDTEDATPVAMVNETMANRFWPGVDPIGHTLRADLGITYTVVGVFEDGKYTSLRETPSSYLVLPETQAEPSERVNLIVKTRGEPSALMPSLQVELQSLAPGLPPSTIQTLPQYLAYSSGNARGAAIVVGFFGVLALLISAVGLFGVMSYSVGLRAREFGVRLALGATSSSVLRLVLSAGTRTTLIGVGIGLLVATMATRVLAGTLYGVGTHDPIVFVLVPLGILFVGQLASYLPARNAAKADPVKVLRTE